MRGSSIQDSTDNKTENSAEGTTPVTVKVVKLRVKFVRESYMMREGKPIRNVLTTADNNKGDHIYNSSIKEAI